MTTIGRHTAEVKRPLIGAIQLHLIRLSLFIGIYVSILVFFCATTSMVTNAQLSALLALPLIACVIYLLYRLLLVIPVAICNSRLLFFVVHVISFFTMSHIALRLVPSIGWDWGRLLLSAESYVTSGVIENEPYFIRYPNNQFWLSCLIVFFKLCDFFFHNVQHDFLMKASIYLSVALIQLTIMVIRCIGRKVLGERCGFVLWALCFFYPPFYCYSPFAYTDTPALLTCSLMVLCTTCSYPLYRGSSADDVAEPILKQYAFFGVALGFLASIASKLKVMLLIVVVAIILHRLLTWRRVRLALVGITSFIISFAIMTAILNIFVSAFISPSADEKDQYEFPALHWIMMSLDYGGYSRPDVDYTMSFPTYNERVEADKEVILERVRERGHLKTLEFITVTKAVRTWGSSNLNGDDYVHREPTHPKSKFVRFFSREGDLYHIFLPYSWLTYLLLLMGIVLEFLTAVWNRSEEKPLSLLYSFIGVYIFFSLWECNPRYLVPFIPVLLLCSADGWRSFTYAAAKNRYDTNAFAVINKAEGI